jgi:integrase
VSFYDKDGERRYIRLGEIGKKRAESIAGHVQQMANATYAGELPDAEQAAWLAKIGQDLADKLAVAGLIAKRQPAEPPPASRLAEFLDEYMRLRTDVKRSTKIAWTQARDYLVKHFGADRDIASITPGEADEWRIWLKSKDGAGLSDNTLRRHCGRAKQFFRAAVRKRLITENPFAEMKDCEVKANRERDFFLTRVQAKLVLDACPDFEWRLLFALSRYGGLRCPSEHLSLRWADIDWDRARMTVRSPKTEHHHGKASRVVPLFPELRPYLEAAWDAAEEGAEFVIGRYRHPNSNLRTQLERIISGPARRPGRSSFKTCVRAVRLSWPRTTRHTSRPSGSGIAGSSRPSTTGR